MVAVLIFKAAFDLFDITKAELNPARPPELQARFFLQRGFVQKGEASWMVACQGALPLVLLESKKNTVQEMTECSARPRRSCMRRLWPWGEDFKDLHKLHFAALTSTLRTMRTKMLVTRNDVPPLALHNPSLSRFNR